MQIVTKNTLNTKMNLPNPSPPNVLLEGRGSEEHWWPLGQRETQSHRSEARDEEMNHAKRTKQANGAVVTKPKSLIQLSKHV